MIRLELTQPPVIGTTEAKQEIRLGGFSGLRFLGEMKPGLLRFLTHTDRGPNTDEMQAPEGQKRPFALPSFQPRLVFLEADLAAGTFAVLRQLLLFGPGGKPLSGLPPARGAEIGTDFSGHELPADENGLDLEGITLGPDGTYWLADEYGPSLVHFNTKGQQLDRIRPGDGLPEIFRHRQMNRGFESIAYSEGCLFAALESPLEKPPARFTRIAKVDLKHRQTVAQFAYLLEDAEHGRLSDFTFAAPGLLLAVEKGGKGEHEWKRVYRVRLGAATGGGILPTQKELVIDLTAAGVAEEKVEGIDLVDHRFIALITDNDFGLAGGLNQSLGIAETKSEPPALYLFPQL